MKKLMDIDIVDIIPFNKGIIVARKDTLSSGNTKISFFTYDVKLERPTASTRSAYLLNKFGENFEKIAEQLSDFIYCDVAPLPNKHIAVVYSSGEIGLFNEKGILYWTGDLQYKECPVSGAAAEGKYIWCVVPENNSIVRYSPSTEKIVLRIGGDSSTAFLNPVSISVYDDTLYVCNYQSCKIRTVNLKNYTVADYKTFDEPVYRYIKTNDRELVELESGVYML